jgi:hypothetical protein
VWLDDVEDDDGDLASGPSHCGGNTRVGGRHVVQQTASFADGGDARVDADGCGPDLDGRVGLSEQVVVPGGVGRRAVVRREHCDAGVAEGPVDEWGDALGSGLGAEVVEQEQLLALEGAAEDAVTGAELVDDLAVVCVGAGHSALLSYR